MQLDIAVLSKAGARAYNEDACGHWSSEAHACCVLSDGVGGLKGGEVASRLVVRHILEGFRRKPVCQPAELGGLIVQSNQQLVAEQAKSEVLKQMRATVVALALDLKQAQASWSHVGDSRLYLFRQSQLLLQTRDDSVVQEMCDAGLLGSHEIRHTPLRCQLLAALGDENGIVPNSIGVPFDLNDGDVFLLCSDGFWEPLTEQEMKQSLMCAQSASEWLAQMDQRIMARALKNQDNYSAIVVWCKFVQQSDQDVTMQGGHNQHKSEEVRG